MELVVICISPCLPPRREHKGGVEGDIKYVKRTFLPLFREAQKERGHEIPDAGELGEELERGNRESYDLHVVQKVGRTPLELFESEEAPALRPLPMTRWDQVLCKELGVGPDWRVQFERAFYTVPYRLIGERVLVLGNSQVMRIFLDFEEVTTHPRAKQLWQVRRRPEHAPPQLEQYLNLTHEGLVQWAGRLGPSVALVAQEIFADQAVDGMRPVRALIRLADKYTTKRLEAACRRAMPRPATAASRTSWFMNWTDCHRSNPRSRRMDRFSSGSHVSTATSTATRPRRLVASQGHRHGRISTPEAQAGAPEAVRHAGHPERTSHPGAR